MVSAGTSNELDVQNEWEENTHSHTHIFSAFWLFGAVFPRWLNRRGEDGTALGAPGGPIIEFTEGTIDEAIAELYRRESEDAEAKRCRFTSYVTKRG